MHGLSPVDPGRKIDWDILLRRAHPVHARGVAGRIRSCRGIGAALSTEEVKRFDAEHEELLRSIAPERFTVLHRIDAHVFEFKDRS
jgi:hypothetical protein